MLFYIIMVDIYIYIYIYTYIHMYICSNANYELTVTNFRKFNALFHVALVKVTPQRPVDFRAGHRVLIGGDVKIGDRFQRPAKMAPITRYRHSESSEYPTGDIPVRGVKSRESQLSELHVLVVRDVNRA